LAKQKPVFIKDKTGKVVAMNRKARRAAKLSARSVLVPKKGAWPDDGRFYEKRKEDKDKYKK